jgi:riboflavin biosynthesis pyrimidine reductase
VLCEGGPTLLREVVAGGCLDDLVLTVAPLLVAGDAPRIVEGPELPEPARLHLREVHRAGDHVFLHYGAGA